MIKKKPSPRFKKKRKGVEDNYYEMIEPVKQRLNPWKALSLFTSPRSMNVRIQPRTTFYRKR